MQLLGPAQWRELADHTKEASRTGATQDLAAWVAQHLSMVLEAHRSQSPPPAEVQELVKNHLWGENLTWRALDAALPLLSPARAYEVADRVFLADLVRLDYDRGSDGGLRLELANVQVIRGTDPGRWLGVAGPHEAPPPVSVDLPGAAGRDRWGPSRAVEPAVRVLAMQFDGMLAGPIVAAGPEDPGFLRAGDAPPRPRDVYRWIEAWAADNAWPPPVDEADAKVRRGRDAR